MTQPGTLTREQLRACYQALLEREPSERELDDWQAYAANLSFADVLRGFLASEEALSAYSRRAGMFAPPGHFYSPIVRAGSQPPLQASEPLETDLRPGVQAAVFAAMVEIAPQLPYSDHPDAAYRYHFENNSFDYPDAVAYAAMLQRCAPRRVVEVGSGFSSAFLLDELDRSSSSAEVTFIEPYPAVLRRLLRPGDATRVTLRESMVQDVGLAVFAALESNDILFIDSSHVAKTGSDVLFLYFQVLPRLARGVLVHIHDIFWPFEYPRGWIDEDNRSWNEAYLLRAMLANNTAFAIEYWNDYWKHAQQALVQAQIPRMMAGRGGSIWLRKTSVV